MRPLEGFANLGAHELARLTESGERTARRWIAEGLAPRFVVRWLELTLRGALELISPAWRGWSLRGDKLHSPDGYAFTPDELRAIPLRLQEVSTLVRDAERLRDQLTERERALMTHRPALDPETAAKLAQILATAVELVSADATRDTTPPRRLPRATTEATETLAR